MIRSLWAYIYFPLFVVGFLYTPFFILTFTKRWFSKKLGGTNVGVFYYSIVLISMLFFFGTVYAVLASSTHLPLFLLSFVLMVLLFVVLKDDLFVGLGVGEGFLPVLAVLIGSLHLSLILYVQDYGRFPYIDFYEKDLDYSLEIPDTQFKDYEGDYLLPINAATRYVSADISIFKSKILHIYNVTDRTPLISFVLLPLFTLFGWNFFVYQTLMVVLCNLFLIPVFYFFREFLDTFKSFWAVLFLAFSHFFVFTNTFCPSKTIALFFIFSGFSFFIRYTASTLERDLLLASLMFCLSYLTHQFSLLYFVILLCLGFFQVLRRGFNFKYACIVACILLLPVCVCVFAWRIYSAQFGLVNEVYSNIMFKTEWKSAGPSIGAGERPSSYEISTVVLSKEFWAHKYYNFLGYFSFNPKKGVESRLFDFNKITLLGAIGSLVSYFLILGIFPPVLLRNKTLLFILGAMLLLPVLYNGFYIRMGLMWYALGAIPIIYILFFRVLEMLRFGPKLTGLVSALNVLYYEYLVWHDTRHTMLKRLIYVSANYEKLLIVILGFILLFLLVLFGMSYEKRMYKHTR